MRYALLTEDVSLRRDARALQECASPQNGAGVLQRRTWKQFRQEGRHRLLVLPLRSAGDAYGLLAILSG